MEEEDEEEEHGAEPAGPGCGLAALHTSPDAAGGSRDNAAQVLELP